MEKNTERIEPHLPPETREMFAQMRETLAAQTESETREYSLPTLPTEQESVPATPTEETPEPTMEEEPVHISLTEDFPEGPPPTPAAAGDAASDDTGSGRPGGPAPAPQPPTTPRARGPIQVGLLVWALILALVGFLMLVSAISISASLQGFMVGALVLVGVMFVVLAITTGKTKPDTYSGS